MTNQQHTTRGAIMLLARHEPPQSNRACDSHPCSRGEVAMAEEVVIAVGLHREALHLERRVVKHRQEGL